MSVLAESGRRNGNILRSSLLVASWLRLSDIRHSGVDSPCDRLRHAVRCVRFLSTLADLDYSWFMFNNLAHCFSSDSPYLGELRNSVVLLDESLFVEEAIAVNRLPEVRRISNRLAVECIYAHGYLLF